VERTKRGIPQAQEFGRRVRHARERLGGVSQERLAEMAGFHRTYIGHIERGEVNLSLYNLIRLGAALGVDPSELVRGLEP